MRDRQQYPSLPKSVDGFISSRCPTGLSDVVTDPSRQFFCRRHSSRQSPSVLRSQHKSTLAGTRLACQPAGSLGPPSSTMRGARGSVLTCCAVRTRARYRAALVAMVPTACCQCAFCDNQVAHSQTQSSRAKLFVRPSSSPGQPARLRGVSLRTPV